MAGESAQEKADEFAARRRQARADQGHLRLFLVVTGLAVVAGAASHVVFGAWWPGALLMILIAATQLGPSQREIAWRRGAEGERVAGSALDRLAGDGVYVLHDRRVPGSRANIDHLLVGPFGVVIIDAKQYRGKLEAREGGRELWVAGRNRSKLLTQALGQADVVRTVLASRRFEAPVRPALCFVGTEWPVIFRPREIRGVELVSPRRVRRLLVGRPVLDSSSVEGIVHALEQELPPAGGGTGRGTGGPRSPQPPRPPRLPAAARVDQAAPARSSSGRGEEFAIRRWKRFGHDRLYANLPDGRTAGYIDVPTGQVVIELAEHAAAVRHRLEAARAALQS